MATKKICWFFGTLTVYFTVAMICGIGSPDVWDNWMCYAVNPFMFIFSLLCKDTQVRDAWSNYVMALPVFLFSFAFSRLIRHMRQNVYRNHPELFSPDNERR